MQRPMQDIYTVVLFVVFFLLLGMTGLMAVNVLERSGIELSDTTLTSMQSDNPTAFILLDERNGFNACEVIYHQASGNGDFAEVRLPETEQAGSGILHYAVYTCTGITATAGNYI